MRALDHYREIWVADFEFRQPPGETPGPICMVAREFRSGRLLRLWADELSAMASAPFDTGPKSLFVAYYASSELGCFLSLGWSLPDRILDLFAEFRCQTNGLILPNGSGLLGALTYHGFDAMAGVEKESMRDLAIRGSSFTNDEKEALVDYCQTDVDALAKLLPAMMPKLDLPRALLRGRYMAAAARIERNGIPVDTQVLQAMRSQWKSIKMKLIDRIDSDWNVYEGTSFKYDRFAQRLADRGIPWPRLDTGLLSLSDDTFRQTAKQYPEIAPLRELRHTLGSMRLESLTVGSDSRNRCMLSTFRASTGRNQPSNAKFIFGPSCWIRSLIRPEPGMAVAYVDWSQQEIGIAAALSGDAAMMAAYESGDFYLSFAKQAGAVPKDATKESHFRERSQFKVCALAVQYGTGPKSIANSLERVPNSVI